jgi:hypothetical protein
MGERDLERETSRSTAGTKQRDMALQNAAQRDVLRHRAEADKTKPLGRLSPRQRAAARLLALGNLIVFVARRLKIHRGTISRWQRSPAFQWELDRLQDLLAERATGRVESRDRSTPHRERHGSASRIRSARPTSRDLSRQYGFNVPAGSAMEKLFADVEEQRAAARKRFAQLSTPRHRSG